MLLSPVYKKKKNAIHAFSDQSRNGGSPEWQNQIENPWIFQSESNETQF